MNRMAELFPVAILGRFLKRTLKVALPVEDTGEKPFKGEMTYGEKARTRECVSERAREIDKSKTVPLPSRLLGI